MALLPITKYKAPCLEATVNNFINIEYKGPLVPLPTPHPPTPLKRTKFPEDY